jgi:hypothetical protein
MGDFFELVAAVCLANYILAFGAVASRRALNRHFQKKYGENA